MAEEGNAAPRPGSADEPGDATQPFEAVRPDAPGAGTGTDAPGSADPDATAVSPPVTSGVDETRLDGTPVGPPLDAPGAAGAAAAAEPAATPAAWSARAAVRPPGSVPPAGTEWDEGAGGDPYQGRSWIRPVVIALIVAVLLALLGLGIWLIVRASHGGSAPGAPPSSSPEAPTTSAAPSPTTAAPTTAAPTTAAPTTAAPTAAGQIPVPELVGLTEADARQALQGLGLRIRVNRVPNTAPPGTVLSTSPPAGAMVNPGDVVTVVVASAPPAPATTAAPSSSR